MSQTIHDLFCDKIDLFHHTSTHCLPIAFTKGLRAMPHLDLTREPIPVYSLWPERKARHGVKNLVDFYQFKAPFKVGHLNPLGLFIENKSVVLRAQLLYTNPAAIASEVFQSLDLMTLSVDKIPGDPASGRRVIGIRRAILTPRPEVIG